MIRAWRIVKAVYALRSLDGQGARRFGGRWNLPGYPVLYASDSLASALLEVLVHFDSALPMAEYVYTTLELPDESIFPLAAERLPATWPGRASLTQTQALGHENLIEQSRFALAVPSSIVPGASNFVINNAHPDFELWAIRQLKSQTIPLPIDIRLFAASERT
jgi:RES domain-containing protein